VLEQIDEISGYVIDVDETAGNSSRPEGAQG